MGDQGRETERGEARDGVTHPRCHRSISTAVQSAGDVSPNMASAVSIVLGVTDGGAASTSSHSAHSTPSTVAAGASRRNVCQPSQANKANGGQN